MVNPEQRAKFTDEKISELKLEIQKLKNQLKLNEDKYRLAREKYDLFFKHSPDIVCEVELDGPKFINVNDTLCEKLGYTRQELLEKNPTEFMDDESRIKCQETIKQYLDGEIFNGWVEYTAHSRDGQKISGEVYVLPNYENGKLVSAIGFAHDISELKLAEKIMKESDARLHSVLDNCRDVIIRINLQSGKYEFVSTSIIDLIGYLPEEIINMDEKRVLESIHPDDLSSLQAAQIIAEETGQAEAEYRQLSKYGKYIWVSNHMAVEKDGEGKPLYRISNVRNITEKKKAEDALKESILQYKTLVNTLSDGIIVQSNYKIRYANPAALKLFRTNTKEILGKSIFKLIPEEMHDLTKKRIKQAAVRQTPPIEYKFIRSDGSTFDGEITSKNILYQNKSATQMVIRNITERKKAEKHQKELLEKEKELTKKLKISNKSMKHIQKELRETINKLENSNQDLEQFAYVASHDLQEPLRMITNFSQLLEKKCKDKLDEEDLEYLDFLVDGAYRMKDLIDDLLTYSRLKTKTKPFKSVNLENILNDVISDLNKAIEETKAQITYDPLPQIIGDPSQIRQLFQNLISNALKFHGDEPPLIHISVKESGRMWKIGINDNGIGIPQEQHQKIFEVFRRLHTREEYPGTGIGLSISKRIVEGHNGRIWIESEPEKGSTFYFTIPRIEKHGLP